MTNFKKSGQRATQKLKLLLNNPTFIKDIQSIREKWQIDKDRFDSANIKKWFSNLATESSKYFAQNKDLKDIKDINDNIPINAFNNDIKLLCTKYKLSSNFYNTIAQYLLTNNITIPISPVIEYKFTKDLKKIEYIKIKIDPTTTLEDIKAIWSSVKLYQKDLVESDDKFYQPIRKLDRDLYVLELKKQGKKPEEIASFLRKEYDEYLGYADVYKIIERLQKRLDII